MIEHSIGDLFERSARAHGPLTAVVHGDRRITFTEMASEVRRAGRALLALGLRRGDTVAVLMGDRPELVALIYGAQWAGLAVVPLNTKQAAADHTYIVRDSSARVLCHDRKFGGTAEDVRRQSDVEHLISVDPDATVDGGEDYASLLKAQSDAPGAPEVAPDDLAAIYYTGGTTGQPKGVAHSHRTLIAAFLSQCLEVGLGERDVFAHVAPLTHASGAFILPVWLRGGTNVILGGFDPELLVDTIARERVTATLMVPTMIYMLLETPAAAQNDLSSLSTVVYGAAPMGRERLVEAIDMFGPVFAQIYGQTEAPNQLTVLTKSDHADAIASGDLTRLSSCGRPVTIARLRITDDDLVDMQPGEAGEIVVSGPHVMLGYWNKPDATALAVRDGWLRTADVGKVDERGYVYIVDRKKDMIITGGFNVYPKEVEQTLFEHPAVRDVCVIGVPDPKWGEAVKAIVVSHPDARPDAAELMAWVKQLKGSVLAPKSVEFVDAIPLTALGKHDKQTLRRSYWAGHDRSVG